MKERNVFVRLFRWIVRADVAEARRVHEEECRRRVAEARAKQKAAIQRIREPVAS